MSHRKLLTLLIAVMTGVAYALPQQALQQALTAYTQAQESSEREQRLAGFQRAERLFDSAVQQGLRNADLYANLGTAALQAERLGPAVLAFRRALALDPDHARAIQNLVHARSLLPAWVPRPEPQGVLDSFFFWHRSLSASERTGIAAVCFALAAVGFAIAIRWRSPLARNLALLPALLWLGLLASLVIDAQSGAGQQAVVIVDEAMARAADSAYAPARFAEPLPGGTEVEVLEARERWVRIGLANGPDAWVSRASLVLIEDEATEYNIHER